MRNAMGLVVVLLAACGGKSTGKVTNEGDGAGTGDVTPVDKDDTVVEEKEPPPPPPPPTLEERVAFHDGCFASFLAEDSDFFERCYSDFSSEEFVDGGEAAAGGKDQIAAQTKPFWDGFTLEGETRLNLASGDNLVNIALFRGKSDGEFMGAPPSGKVFGMLGAEAVFLDAEGRHGMVKVYMDMATMMGQLGLAPLGTKVRPTMELSGAPATTVIATGSDVETANVATVQAGFEAFNKHDPKALLGFYSGDAVISQQWARADLSGAKAIEKSFKELFKAFPDAKDEIGTIWGAGDYVVVETTFSGTNKAAAPGMGIKKATKRSATVHGLTVFHLVDGKATEEWSFGNGMAFAMQLGLMK